MLSPLVLRIKPNDRTVIFALTTRWNAGRHASGEGMIQEILELGFDHVELGYDTRVDLVPGVTAMVEQGAVKVDSLHNFCPVPIGAGRGHPETFTFAHRDRRIREQAIRYTIKTIRFAAELGARVVVSHAGNVEMRNMTGALLTMIEANQRLTPRFEKERYKLQERRDKRAPRHVKWLYEAIEKLMPALQETGIQLALEILPTWEALPSEVEFEGLFKRFGSTHLRYWHDIGHARIRENLGFINMERWLERLQPHLAGMHLHDVDPPGRDHVMPPDGDIDFARFARFGQMDILRVIEPMSNTPREVIRRGLEVLREAWAISDSSSVASDTNQNKEQKI